LLTNGVVVLGKDGHIKYLNPEAMRIVGLGPEHQAADFATRTAALPIYDADGEPVPPQLRPVAQLFRTGVAFSRQVYGTELPNGQRRWMLASGCLLNPDAPADSDMLFSFSDITTEAQRSNGWFTKPATTFLALPRRDSGRPSALATRWDGTVATSSSSSLSALRRATNSTPWWISCGFSWRSRL
jgi:hypothetical protein